MRFKPADDKSARPILYYRLNGKLIRFRIAKHGAGGKNFVSGDAKPFGGGTDDYVCKYTVPGDVTGEFGAAVGKFNADKDGNTLAKFYTHQKQVTLGVDNGVPGGQGGPVLQRLDVGAAAEWHCETGDPRLYESGVLQTDAI